MPARLERPLSRRVAQAHSGLALDELAHRRDLDTPYPRELAELLQLLRADREEQLVVLASVQREGERRRRRAPARARAALGSTGTAEASIDRPDSAAGADLDEVERQAVREVHPRPREAALGDRAGERERRARVELGAKAGQDRGGRGLRPHPGGEQLRLLVEARALGEEAYALGRGPERPRHHDAITRPGAGAQQEPPRVAEQRDVHDDRLAAARHVAADEGHPGLRRPLQQAVVERVHPAQRDVGRQAEAHRCVARDAAHRGHVREVDGQRLAAEESRRGRVAVEVDALDQAVRGDEGEGGGLDGGRVVAEADHDAGRRRDAPAEVAQKGLLPDLSEGAREWRGQSEALRIVVWLGDLNRVTRWEP